MSSREPAPYHGEGLPLSFTMWGPSPSNFLRRSGTKRYCPSPRHPVTGLRWEEHKAPPPAVVLGLVGLTDASHDEALKTDQGPALKIKIAIPSLFSEVLVHCLFLSPGGHRRTVYDRHPSSPLLAHPPGSLAAP
jgi:hypothetical protein